MIIFADQVHDDYSLLPTNMITHVFINIRKDLKPSKTTPSSKTSLNVHLVRAFAPRVISTHSCTSHVLSPCMCAKPCKQTNQISSYCPLSPHLLTSPPGFCEPGYLRQVTSVVPLNYHTYNVNK